MINWSEVKTVLLDMDGTILDLHFDNHFWLEHVPMRYSQAKNISLADAHEQLHEHYLAVQGTINWYCLDYWAEITQLPITALKREVAHLIHLREDARAFLTALKASGRDVVLVTNAHPDSLSLKIEKTQLDQYFNTLYSTHEFGVTKESQLLWDKLEKHHGFEKSSTLFIDDSLPILTSAQQFGIAHLLAVANPDSQKEKKSITGFKSVTDFHQLIPFL